MVLEYLDTAIAFIVILLGISLLITILNQMISALLAYRGTNLLWGVKMLLCTVEPKLKEKAEEVGAHLLTKRSISDSLFSEFKEDGMLVKLTRRWRLANAIEPDELVRGLKKVAEKLGSSDKATADLIDGLFEADPDLAEKARMIRKTFAGLKPDYALQLDKLIQQVGKSAEQSIGQVEAWFNIIMKRASQRFSMQMRIWTIVFAFVIAFAAHVDSFTIVRELWTSPKLRASLVNARDTILSEASVILSAQDGKPAVARTGIPSRILGDAMNKLANENKDMAGLAHTVPVFTTLDEATSWLQKNLKPNQDKDVTVAAYRDLVLTELKGHADKIKEELAKSGFQFHIPDSWQALINFKDVSIPGILVTVCFLSLGAPFWFNTLRNLGNLRPLVAKSGSAATESSPS